MRSEQMHPTTSDLLNKVREATVRYPNISQLRDSDSANLATDPAGGVGAPPTANSVFLAEGGGLAWPSCWPQGGDPGRLPRGFQSFRAR